MDRTIAILRTASRKKVRYVDEEGSTEGERTHRQRTLPEAATAEMYGTLTTEHATELVRRHSRPKHPLDGPRSGTPGKDIPWDASPARAVLANWSSSASMRAIITLTAWSMRVPVSS